MHSMVIEPQIEFICVMSYVHVCFQTYCIPDSKFIITDRCSGLWGVGRIQKSPCQGILMFPFSVYETTVYTVGCAYYDVLTSNNY